MNKFHERINGLGAEKLDKWLNRTGYNWQDVSPNRQELSAAETFCHSPPGADAARDLLKRRNPLLLKVPVTMRDALANLNVDNMRNDEDVRYGKGVLVGIVSALMAMTGCGLEEVMVELKHYMGAVDARCIPEGW